MPGRNDPCPCGSGKKYKKCCGRAQLAAPHTATVPPADLNRLIAMIDTGLFPQLESEARDMAAQYPESGIVWKLLGVSQRMQGKDALHALQRAAALLPDDPEAHGNLGNALRDLGQLDAAVASYRRALELKPDFAEAHSNFANALCDLGRFQEAAAGYRRALELKPDYPEAHNNLGLALRGLGLHDEAAASCRRALELKPDFAAAHNNLGNALRGLGRLDEAAASYRRALMIRPHDADAHSNLGNALLDAGLVDDALASYAQAILLKPDLAEAHLNLGNVLRVRGQFEDAAASYRRALDIKPDYAGAHSNLGDALRDLGRLEDSAASCRRALDIRPDDAGAHNSLGNALLDLGRLDDAQACYRRALALHPGLAVAHLNLAIVLRLQGRTADAEASCGEALGIKADCAPAMALLAELHADQGRFSQAQALFERALSIEPELLEAWAGLAQLRKMTDGDAAWLAEAQRIAGQPLPPRREVYLRYALAKCFDDIKDFPQAFSNVRRANELTRLYSVRYDRRQLKDTVDLITRTCDAKCFSESRIDANASSRPVFIVGMPRSGTSLAEQILASHPDVFGAGELPFWVTASAALGSPVPGAGMGSVLRKLADDYLSLLKSLSAGALRVIDKMPANFLSLGLIHAALPNARIIHMRRNPIDTCLSIYFQHFKTGHAYANDLTDLEHYYTEYLRVMEHWGRTLPAEAMLDVPYEDLVDDHEGWSRKMLQYIGLSWDPKCVDFHLTDRTVMTASKWQVRQKMSKSSIERWRNYEKFLSPLLGLIEPSPGRR
ncbi:MAG TPA: tetratricopeptide repeat protein [Steroidobacteraceae bacterium]|nr:tetratricopeptide repeat protein [Steroidobacteraceae bacterium]